MTKTEQFHQLQEKGTLKDKVLFRPILMQFAAEYIGKNYGQFASDYKVLVESNLRCKDDFSLDMLGLISDPYRETSAFGAKIKYVSDGVPRCLNLVVKSIDDVKNLKIPDIYKAERTFDRIQAAKVLSKKTQGNIPIIGWIEGPLADNENMQRRMQRFKVPGSKLSVLKSKIVNQCRLASLRKP